MKNSNILSSLAPPTGGSTPPGITAPTVTSIPSPISVNGFTGLPPPQANGQAPAEAMFTNGIHPYPGTTLIHRYTAELLLILISFSTHETDLNYI